MDLYHSDIRLPDWFRMPHGVANLKWTNHAEQARHTDRYGTIPRLATLLLDGCEPIEVGIENGKVCHLLLRFNYGQGDRDVVMAIKPIRAEPWIVKTVWFNLRSDRHTTLNRSKYIP